MKTERIGSADFFAEELRDGSMAILDARSETVYSLNATAAAAWNACARATTLGDVVQIMQASFNPAVTEETAMEALLRLQEHELIWVSAFPLGYSGRSVGENAAGVSSPTVAVLTSREELLDLSRRIDQSCELFLRISGIPNQAERDHAENVTRSTRKLAPHAGLAVWRILKRTNRIEGWLNDEEADLLMAATALALTRVSRTDALVEVGSYCGRSTCVIASVVQAIGVPAKVHAIDPHEGRVGAEGQKIEIMAPTLEKLKGNLRNLGLTDHVVIVQARSWEVVWNQPASLIFIDGLHDYENAARDFRHFEPWLAAGGYAAFHDYSRHYPGVVAFVDELLSNGCYEEIDRAGGLLVMRRRMEK